MAQPCIGCRMQDSKACPRHTALTIRHPAIRHPATAANPSAPDAYGLHAAAHRDVGVRIGPAGCHERRLEGLGARERRLQRWVCLAEDEVVPALDAQPEPARRLHDEAAQVSSPRARCQRVTASPRRSFDGLSDMRQCTRGGAGAASARACATTRVIIASRCPWSTTNGPAAAAPSWISSETSTPRFSNGLDNPVEPAQEHRPVAVGIRGASHDRWRAATRRAARRTSSSVQAAGSASGTSTVSVTAKSLFRSQTSNFQAHRRGTVYQARAVGRSVRFRVSACRGSGLGSGFRSSGFRFQDLVQGSGCIAVAPRGRRRR